MALLSQVSPALIACVLALALGGVLKGATGAGAPVVAVPVISLFYGVQTAVVVMLMSNLLSNMLQGWRYRSALPHGSLIWMFAGAGLIGAAIGTVMLARIDSGLLLQAMAVTIFVYIAFRLSRPQWLLSPLLAHRLALPVGLLGGVLQGATGISAPVSLSFVSALGLPRAGFVACVSLFFVAMTAVQIPFLAAYGLLSVQGLGLGLVAFGIIMAAMPLGEALARHMSPRTFDHVILALLAVIAVNILV